MECTYWIHLPAKISTKKREPKITVDEKPIISFDIIFPNNQYLRINYGKYYKLDRYCVTLNKIIDNHFKQTEYTDVICETNSDKKGRAQSQLFTCFSP